ncbi:MAG TPA: hypothetical protein VF252_11795 [Gemmatimonadales bacterium]
MSAASPPLNAPPAWRYPWDVLQRSFAVVPLVYFTGQGGKMGPFVNSRPLAALAWTVAVTIMGLNAWLLVGTFRMWLA